MAHFSERHDEPCDDAQMELGANATYWPGALILTAVDERMRGSFSFFFNEHPEANHLWRLKGSKGQSRDVASLFPPSIFHSVPARSRNSLFRLRSCCVEDVARRFLPAWRARNGFPFSRLAKP